MKLALDPASFTAPLDAATHEAYRDYIGSGAVVGGAQERSRVAARAYDNIRAFDARLEGILRDGGFDALPRLVGASIDFHYFRHLTIGPWRGVFIVHPDMDTAIGVIFSKEPHDMSQRLDELAASVMRDVASTVPAETPPGDRPCP